MSPQPCQPRSLPSCSSVGDAALLRGWLRSLPIQISPQGTGFCTAGLPVDQPLLSRQGAQAVVCAVMVVLKRLERVSGTLTPPQWCPSHGMTAAQGIRASLAWAHLGTSSKSGGTFMPSLPSPCSYPQSPPACQPSPLKSLGSGLGTP